MMVLGQKMVDEHSRFSYGKCLSLPQLVSNATMKQWIGESFGVHVLDMESFWVCKVAAELGKPYLVIRSVLDPMEQTLPTFIGETLGYGRFATLVRAVRYIAISSAALAWPRITCGSRLMAVSTSSTRVCPGERGCRLAPRQPERRSRRSARWPCDR